MKSPDNNRPGLKLLFIHQNFPAQYFHIARIYAADPANTVIAVGEAANLRQRPALPGVTLLGYELPASIRKHNPHTHHYARPYEENIRRGQAAARLFAQLREQGFSPNLICVHPAWGEALFLRLIWPDAPILAYAEHYNDMHGPALDFDPEFPPSPDSRLAAHAANATLALSFADADHLQTPMRFQMNSLPPAFRERCSLLYDGVNTGVVCPDPTASLTLPPTKQTFSRENAPLPRWFPLRDTELTLSRADTVITFTNRTLEPYRGWHSFARALPFIQAACPEAHCVIVGRTSGGYGPPPPNKNWRDIYLEEIRSQVDLTRLHFTGTLPPETHLRLLQLSRAHVYLSYPFVLSYSPVEAMSCAAPLVLSRTEATLEIAEHEQHALFADFHNPEDIARAVLRLLRDPELAARLGRAARERALERYDLETVWVPRWKKTMEALARNTHKEALM